jgi:hypothetical protein
VTRILVLAVSDDDFLDYWSRHPEIHGEPLNYATPGNLFNPLTCVYDRLKTTAAIWLHPLGDTYLRAALTAIRPQVTQ